MEKEIQNMFRSIAARYDLLNHILSFGMDFYWRRSVHILRKKEGGRFLDVAAGTGDYSRAALSAKPRQVVAVDFVHEMLQLAQKKNNIRARSSSKNGTAQRIEFVVGDVEFLPLKAESFDAVIVAFGVRNFPNRIAALHAMYRVLKPNGILCILEFARPRDTFFGRVFRWYFHTVVPVLGALISGHACAYQYLPQSVDNFPPAQEFLTMMASAGFAENVHTSLTFGIASLFTGRKP